MDTSFNVLFRIGKRNRITRIYSEGWDNNLGAWTEEVTELFEELCQFYGDDPTQCGIVGEARWVWMRFSGSMRATIRDDEFSGAQQVTMIRVHRANTPGFKRSHQQFS